MILVLLLIIPFIGGVTGWAVSRRSPTGCRWTALLCLFANIPLLVVLSARYAGHSASAIDPWLTTLQWPWIPALEISFKLGIDGLSLLMAWLTVLLGILAVVASWSEIRERVGFFHLNLMLALVGILGVFTALDLFLFYFFWEIMLVPMFFLIRIWGHENRVYAAMKFFIFTQAGGLLMLLSILGLYFIHGRITGLYTLVYDRLLSTPVAGGYSLWLMLGFFIAFAVKLPVVPVHTWLPDAHTEAPTAGSVILAGLLLKTGAYGLLRFVLPLFAGAAREIAPAAMLLGVLGIVYGAVLAFAQRDIKRLVAYTSISHLGFVLFGIFAGNLLALQGAVILLLAHGLGTGGLFILVGALQERIHTRDLNSMGGLWGVCPRMGGVAMFLAMASLGLPGLGNFVGEFLILLGAWRINPGLTLVAAMGFVFSTVYSLTLIQKVFHGPQKHPWAIPDLGIREMVVMGLIMAGLVGMGVYPQPLLDAARPTIEAIQQRFPATTETTDVAH
jgi:NADH-quinone oxidoreductase subunit M